MRLILCLLLLTLTSCRQETATKRHAFVDMLGRSVAISVPVQRVVTAGAIPAINSVLVLLHKQGAIQNGMPKQLHAGRWAMLRKITPGLMERPVVSSMGPEWTPDYEALSKLSYDVVVLDSPATATSMQQRGIPAVAVRWSGVDSAKDVVQSLGRLTGATDRAHAYAAYFDSMVQRVKSRLTVQMSHPSALYVRLDNFTLPIVSNSRDIVVAAGGRYAVDPSQLPDHATFSHEQLVVWDPECLFVWSPSEREKIYADARFADLRAVKNHQVHPLPMGTHLWLHYSPEVPLGILWVAHVLHPDVFTEAELKREVVDFYAKFYDYALKDAEVEAMLAGRS